MQNGFIETFNGRMRDELLNETLLFDLADACPKITNWVAYYNIRRPQSSLKCLSPAAYAAHLTQRTIGYATPNQLTQSSVAPPAPLGVQKLRDSNRCWMKTEWLVNANKARFQKEQLVNDRRGGCFRRTLCCPG
jgi:Integrase core domain